MDGQAGAMAFGKLWSVTLDPHRWRVLLDPAGHPFCITAMSV
jgi:hypothetical protein